MTYPFSFGFVITDGDNHRITGDALDEIVDRLMEALLERETDLVSDSSVGAALVSGELDIDLEVSARDAGAAAAMARDLVIQAIQAIGGTPVGLFTFPAAPASVTPRQEWHERKAELTSA